MTQSLGHNIALDFGTGKIQDCFHKFGIDRVVKDLLKMNVEYQLDELHFAFRLAVTTHLDRQPLKSAAYEKDE